MPGEGFTGIYSSTACIPTGGKTQNGQCGYTSHVALNFPPQHTHESAPQATAALI